VNLDSKSVDFGELDAEITILSAISSSDESNSKESESKSNLGFFERDSIFFMVAYLIMALVF